jgi:drug/metabolite transporter (DMT)-like permease
VEARGPRPLLLAGVTLALFLVWSSTFLAFETLLAPPSGEAPLRWVDLLAARFVPAAILCGGWVLLFRRAESTAILRRHPGRLLLAGALCVPGYNALLYHGMEGRVEGPVASVLTSLTPLYLAVLGAAFLGERLTRRKVAGLALGFGGVALLATAKEGGGASRAILVAEVALAPLFWSCYSALTRPVAREHSPLVWTFLVLAAGGVLSTPLLFLADFGRIAALDGKGIALVAGLVLLATVFGFAAWSWLLSHLPASTVGLTVFLNPPLTMASKFVLATLLPASFVVSITPREWAGGALALLGVGVAVVRFSGAPEPTTTPRDGRAPPSR